MKQYPITKISNVFYYSYLRQYLLLISQLVILLISKVLFITHILSSNSTQIPGIILLISQEQMITHLSGII